MCAALALCQEPSGMQPCGRCQSCGIRRSGIHPDFLTIQPHTDSPRIPIEDVRALRKFLSFTPAVGRFKIVVIDKAESLSDEGANALLKSLEEPPQQSVIILITAYPHAILPTIRSRLLVLRFQTIPVQTLVLWLKKEFTSVSMENAHVIAEFSAGRPGRAKMLAQTPAEFSKEQTRWEEFSRFTSASLFEKLALLVSFKDREQFIHTKMSWSVAAHTILSSELPLRAYLNPSLMPRKIIGTLMQLLLFNPEKYLLFAAGKVRSTFSAVYVHTIF